ncbi:MAG: response regulator [Anaerolineae bacterium]|jgi:signal transduction histidine kinase|nr:response regulator [Anaerolineae bacterium]
MAEKQPLVLVVDDHYPAAEMVSRLFMGNQYRVICAYNGEDALRQIAQTVPDLILLDVMMPGMSGFEVLEKLRQDASTANIPAIMVTAKDAPADIEYGLNLGADDYLTKPVEPRELLARARSKIEAHRLRQALQRRTRDLESLLYVGEQLNNQRHVQELHHLIMQLMLALLPGDFACILPLDEARQPAQLQHLARSGTLPDTTLEISPIFEAVQQQSWLQWTDENASDPRLAHGMAVALQYDEQMTGILLMCGPEPYDAHHVRLFQGIGRQASLAARNAELYEIQVRYAENLEAMVAERTRELQSAQELLIRSEKLASIGRLAAGIAHEINNPLQPILVIMELMVEDIQSGAPIALHDVQETLASARRIKRTVERLLQFTRKRDQKAPDMELLPIAAVLDNVIALSSKYFEQEGIGLKTELDPALHVYGNRDQLEQVFLNLMLNARAAMQRGGLLTIHAYLHQERNIILFQDTGTGIAPEVMSRIFEPFFTTRDNGNGLGLFISHEIIQNHNGAIYVESQPGQGTLITIVLPAAMDVIDPR